jgi:hypothetical protein
MAFRNVNNTFTVAGRSAYFHKESVWKEMQLNVLYFSEIKLFRGHFEATTYMYIGTDNNGNYSCFLPNIMEFQ